jgi:phytoene/squalene synthetase
MNSQLDTYLTIFNKLDFEKIIDHPNILIAANFWDEDRFLAAKTCYRFMRAIDDLIDNYKSENQEIAEGERALFEKEVKEWINSIHDKEGADPWKSKLTETMNRFKIPLWTMETFATSMIYDIYHDGFASIKTFLDYSKGASIAPASVFVHLCGIAYENGQYNAPFFDVRNAATPCAVFSYIVHIIRDFQKDQHNNLNYFADDLMAKYALDRQYLKDISNGADIPEGFRELIREYYELADEYRLKTYRMIQDIKPFVGPRYQLSLEIIFNLYLMVFERINPDSGLFTATELNPTPQEIRERVYQTILAFQPVEHSKLVNDYDSCVN